MLRLRISTQPISMMRSPFFGSSPVVSVSRTICFNLWYALVRESVGPLVCGVAGVAFHPMPFYLVARHRPVELAPEVHVLHRLPVRGEPAAALPASDPLRDALHHVQRIGVEAHPARALERIEGPDHRRELHPVVGGLRFPAPEFLLYAFRAEQRAPAAGAGIAAAGAVAVDLDHLIGHAGSWRGRCSSGASGRAH